LATSTVLVWPPVLGDEVPSEEHMWKSTRTATSDTTYEEGILSTSGPDTWRIGAIMANPNDFFSRRLPDEDRVYYLEKTQGVAVWDLEWPGKLPLDARNPRITSMVLRLNVLDTGYVDNIGNLNSGPVPVLNFRWYSEAEMAAFFPPDFDTPVVDYVPANDIEPHFSVGFDELVAVDPIPFGFLDVQFPRETFPGGPRFALRAWIEGVHESEVGFANGTAWATFAAFATDTFGPIPIRPPSIAVTYDLGGEVPIEIVMDVRPRVELSVRGVAGPPVYDRAKRKRGW